MKKSLSGIMLYVILVACLSSPAIAAVINQWYDGDQVVYAKMNDLYWRPHLTNTANMIWARQSSYVSSLNDHAYVNGRGWNFANYDQMNGPKDFVAGMGTHVEHEWPWAPSWTRRTAGSPFLAWPVPVDKLFTPTTVMTVAPPLVPTRIPGGLPVPVFNGPMTEKPWRTDLTATPPGWQYGPAHDHFVVGVGAYMTPEDFANMTFDCDVHRLSDDATDRLDEFGDPVLPGPVGTWIVENPQPIPAPGTLLLGSMGVGLVGWLRRRRTL